MHRTFRLVIVLLIVCLSFLPRGGLSAAAPGAAPGTTPGSAIADTAVGAATAATAATAAGATTVAAAAGGPAVGLGWNHSCALIPSGGVKCWGRGDEGELGDGISHESHVPVDVVGLSRGVTAIAVGDYHGCALTAGGAVKCWGQNYYGQLGDGSHTDRLAPVDVVGLSSGVTAIAAGSNSTCAVVTGQGVKCWGRNNYGQFGNGTKTDSATPVPGPGLGADVAGLALAHNHACARLAGGTAMCWGYNGWGELGDGTQDEHLTPVSVSGLSGATAIGAGDAYSCAASSGGGQCWGWNGFGQVGDGTDVLFRLHPVAVLNLSGVSALSSGEMHSCALLSGGAAKCWGSNDYGQLGDGTETDPLSPVQVSGLSGDFVGIAAGFRHSCAIRSDGSAKCWGQNSVGQLGDGTVTDRLTPAEVVGLAGPPVYTLAGAVKDGSQAAVPGVTITDQLGDTATTGVDGGFTLTGLLAGTYTITPTRPGLYFTPTTRTVTIASASVTGKDFTAAPVAWTLMFYLDGDNNLDGSYVPIFNQLERAANRDGVNVVAVWDRLGNGGSAYYKVQYDTNMQQWAAYREGVSMWSKGELDMGNAGTLIDFARWARETYPAQHYALILDDHGSGLGGAMWDDTAHTHIPTADLSTALQAILGAARLDVLVMNACLMGMLEDAYQVRDYVDYYVANENTQTTFSAGYFNTVQGIGTGTTPAQVAHQFVEGYASDAGSYAYTESTGKIANLAGVVTATNHLADVLAGDMATNAVTLTTIAQAVQRFDQNGDNHLNLQDTYVDLYDFARLAKARFTAPRVRQASQQVMDAVAAYILEERHATGKGVDASHGVSIFLPHGNSSFYRASNYAFAAGANWPTQLASGAPEAAMAGGWGAMLVSYVAVTQPGGADDPNPPPLISKPERSVQHVYLPMLRR